MELAKAKDLAIEKMVLHGLVNWKFDWTRATRSYGHCDYTARTIRLSRILTDIVDYEHVLETVLHEIAHALTPGAKHGPVWASKAKELGCKRIKSFSDRTITDAELPPKWVMVYGEVIVSRYMRRPNKSTFARLPNTWMKGKKKESYGKLKLMTWSEYEQLLR